MYLPVETFHSDKTNLEKSQLQKVFTELSVLDAGAPANSNRKVMGKYIFILMFFVGTYNKR